MQSSNHVYRHNKVHEEHVSSGTSPNPNKPKPKNGIDKEFLFRKMFGALIAILVSIVTFFVIKFLTERSKKSKESQSKEKETYDHDDSKLSDHKDHVSSYDGHENLERDADYERDNRSGQEDIETSDEIHIDITSNHNQHKKKKEAHLHKDIQKLVQNNQCLFHPDDFSIKHCVEEISYQKLTTCVKSIQTRDNQYMIAASNTCIAQQKTMILFFYAHDCPPSRSMAQNMRTWSLKCHPHVIFYAINKKICPEEFINRHLRYYPTLMIYRHKAYAAQTSTHTQVVQHRSPKQWHYLEEVLLRKEEHYYQFEKMLVDLTVDRP